jgi:hypothetical protein
MRRIMVRYRVKPGREEDNAELVRAVYAELADAASEGFRYATFRHEQSFFHLAFQEGDGPGPLPGLAAFKAFTAGIAERCDEPPVVAELTEVGSYRF